MAPRRADSFRLALTGLRERLREGVFPPGERIAATEMAALLGLSATPVREALFRISGEGLLEDRRGQGFFVRPLSGPDIADLYRLSLAHLAIALDGGRSGVRGMVTAAGETRPDPAADPGRDIERLFVDWMAEGGGQALWDSYRSLNIRLGPVRRLEPLVLEGVTEEAAALRALADTVPSGARLSALEAFHARRILRADRLAQLLGRGLRGIEV